MTEGEVLFQSLQCSHAIVYSRSLLCFGLYKTNVPDTVEDFINKQSCNAVLGSAVHTAGSHRSFAPVHNPS